jgi:hypothetical protein
MIEITSKEEQNGSVNRLLSVTSLLQLILGMTSLKCSGMGQQTYNDYLIINNVMVGEKASAMIKNIADLWPFKKVVNFKGDLIEFESQANTTNRFKWVCGRDFDACSQLQEKLFGLLQTKFIDQVFLRYKIGLPEHILLNMFPKANVILFEDGLGDYMEFFQAYSPSNACRFKSIFRNIIYNFKKESALKSSILRKTYFERISKKYCLIEDSRGHLKKQYLNTGNAEPFINFREETIEEFKKIKSKKWPVIFNHNKKVIVLLIENYLLSLLPNEVITLDEELSFYDRIIEKLKKTDPDKQIVVKGHPNTSADMCSIYSERYGEMFRKDLNFIPGEILLVEENVTDVIGGFSSLLIYAKCVFSKRSQFFEMPIDVINDHQLYFTIMKETMKRLGVKQINI